MDDCVLLLVEAQSAQKTLDLGLGIRRPNTDVVAVLVGDTGVSSVELGVNAVSVSGAGEEFARDGERSRVGVLGVVDTLGAGKRTRRQFA